MKALVNLSIKIASCIIVLCSVQSSCLGQSLTFDKFQLPAHTITKLSLDTLQRQTSMLFKDFDYNKVYHNSLGIFCKGENLLSKNAPVNLRFRLGSLDYVNKLEGK